MEDTNHVQENVKSEYVEEFEVGTQSVYLANPVQKARSSSSEKSAPKTPLVAAAFKGSDYACDLVRRAVFLENMTPADSAQELNSTATGRDQLWTDGSSMKSSGAGSLHSVTGSVSMKSSGAESLYSVTGSVSTRSSASMEMQRLGEDKENTISNKDVEQWLEKLDTARTSDMRTAASRTMLTASEKSNSLYTANSRTMLTAATKSDTARTAMSRSCSSADVRSTRTAASRTMLTASGTSDVARTALSNSCSTADVRSTRTATSAAPSLSNMRTAASRTMLTASEASDTARTALSNSCSTADVRSTRTAASAAPSLSNLRTAASRTMLTSSETSDPAHTANSCTLLTASAKSDSAMTANSRTMLTASAKSDSTHTAFDGDNNNTYLGAVLKTARGTLSDVATAIEDLAIELGTDAASILATAKNTIAASPYVLTHTPETDHRAAQAIPSVDDTKTAVEN